MMNKEDFLDELGELALGSRLKRLSERMLSDAAKIYQAFGIDVQPKWFTLLALLHKRGTVSVVEAADLLGLSQPAISQFAKQLVDKKLVSFVISQKDSRKRILSLTKLGQQEVDKMQPMWRAVDLAAKQLCCDLKNDFYLSLRKCEQAIDNRSLKERSLEIYKETKA